MASQIQDNFRMRKSFAKIHSLIDIPNLIDIQKQQLRQVLCSCSVDPACSREDIGPAGRLQAGVSDQGLQRYRFVGLSSKYEIDAPKYDVPTSVTSVA